MPLDNILVCEWFRCEKFKTLLVLPLENCVTRIRIKETEEDSDPRKRNEIIQCEAPLKPKI
ncbi:hypothetical protein Avbf_17645 [Armadillidium vulgare]|nr:hypothetical protein Avbf_17645 [Armadillidium vulgare]